MTVPAIVLYASPPPSSMCSTAHPCQINSHATYDFDLNARSLPASSSTAASPSPSQKSTVGGLSRLLASNATAKIASSGEESGSMLWYDRPGEEFSRYSSLSSSIKRDHGYQSPVSVLQGPFCCSSSSGISSGVMSRSPSMRIRECISSVRSGTGGLFNGFVRHALGSYVDSDSTCFQVKDVMDSPAMVDELTFSMEDSSVDLNVAPFTEDLLIDAQNRHKIFHDDLVVKAYYEAEKAHRGQVRASGDPYLKHCVETAVLLAVIGASSTVIAAGLLHDTLDDSFVTYEHIVQIFGVGVADLVEGVSKLSQLSKLARENNTACRTVEADRLHTMFLAMADARAVLIKLADRLHNMMTLDALPSIKQQRFAKETLEIFTPLANRLGISAWKDQLENLCFKYLNPEQHNDLSTKFLKSFDEAVITNAIDKLEQSLKEESISYHDLSGRHKSLYSVYSKMLRKKLNMDEIHDIHGLRLIVENEDDCYKALRVVHQLWPEVPGRSKDYIVSPKFNGYRSLHTVVTGEGMVPLEVQIRTKEMHLQAEYGFAAHWRYKEGACKYSSFVLHMVEWARWVMSWQCETMSKNWSSFRRVDSSNSTCTFPSHSEDCSYSCKPNCRPDGPVFVIMIDNDRMSVREYPANSTMKDLLERVGRESSRFAHYGFPRKEELRPQLNHAPVSDPMCKLKMGDVVELTPAIPDKSLVEYREEIQRMYEMGHTTLPSSSAHKMVGLNN